MSSKYELPTNEAHLAEEFEKLGRCFFDKVDAKNFTQAYEILEQLSDSTSSYPQDTKVYDRNSKLI